MISEKFAARVVLYDASQYSPQGAKDIATWLRKQATLVLKERAKLSKRFTAKYYYP